MAPARVEVGVEAEVDVEIRAEAEAPVPAPAPAMASPSGAAEFRAPTAVEPAGPIPDAQSVGPEAASPESNDGPLTVYLVTAGPGDAVWERFGHNALWIQDRRTGQDIWWNWGLFSFSQQGFIGRLIRGEMLYSMGGRQMSAELAQYRAQGRSVWAQELALTQAQAAELDRFVRRNSMPQNRDYIYDYYEDNCSTRVRDAVDAVLDGALQRYFEARPAGTTWREQTRRHVEVSGWTDTGIALVLGRRGDEPISQWQQMFLPLELRRHLGSLLLEAPDGSMRPLVVREIELVASERAVPPAQAGSRLAGAAALGGVSALVLLLLGWRAGAGAGSDGGAGGGAGGGASGGAHGAGGRSPHRIARGLLLTLVGGGHLVAGLLGIVLVAAYATDHDFWTPNENLLQANPLSFVLAVVVLGSLLRHDWLPRAARGTRWLAIVAALGVVIKAWPGPGQGNLEVLAVTLPTHLAAAWAMARARRGIAPAPDAPVEPVNPPASAHPRP